MKQVNLHNLHASSVRVIIHSLAINLCSYFVVPSASPSTLSTTSVTSESFTLMWQPPPFEETNGIIRNYVIRVTEVNTGQTFTETSNTTQVILVGLHPFYIYECQVAAETVGLGPYSTQITVQLDEEGNVGY